MISDFFSALFSWDGFVINKEEYTADPFDRLSDDVSAYGGIQGKAD